MIGKLRRDEQGIALITVLILTMVALALVSALTAYALGSEPISCHDQDWNAALGAAQAGLNDYVYRLNQNGNYWQYSTTNLPPDGNQAFTTFVTVPDSRTRRRSATSPTRPRWPRTERSS